MIGPPRTGRCGMVDPRVLTRRDFLRATAAAGAVVARVVATSSTSSRLA